MPNSVSPVLEPVESQTVMGTQDSFKDLMQKIVEEHFPDEALVFEFQGDSMIQNLFDNKWEGHVEGHADKYGMADLATAKTILEIVSVMFTTFKIFSEIRLLRMKNEQPDVGFVQLEWERKLKQAGIKSTKAKAIAGEFVKDLAKLEKE